mmetsp:Transcript_76942/g.160087  ORF Transcript_76942/g.160087 Transcript_76942/m.160087 type:complete len:88 (+) Transcript_76942:240-503(+)
MARSGVSSMEEAPEAREALAAAAAAAVAAAAALDRRKRCDLRIMACEEHLSLTPLVPDCRQSLNYAASPALARLALLGLPFPKFREE